MIGPTEFQCGFAPGPVKLGSVAPAVGSCERAAKPGSVAVKATPPAAALAARNQDRREIVSACSGFFRGMQPPRPALSRECCSLSTILGRQSRVERKLSTKKPL